MRNETIYCKVCNKELAWWDMFTNLQYEDEYECQGKFRRLTHGKLWGTKDGKSFLHSRKRDADDIKEYPKEIKSETLPCALYHHTKYCESCARKLKYKCGRPKCKGILRLIRRRDDKPTKYGHGGY